jgi:hypothetical protein
LFIKYYEDESKARDDNGGGGTIRKLRLVCLATLSEPLLFDDKFVPRSGYIGAQNMGLLICGIMLSEDT